MGDKIENLPVDKFPPSHEEREICKWLFGDPITEIKKVTTSLTGGELMRYLYVSLIFFVCSLPVFDGIIKQFIPLCNQYWISLLVCKTIIFIILYWIFCNGNFLKKNE